MVDITDDEELKRKAEEAGIQVVVLQSDEQDQAIRAFLEQYCPKDENGLFVMEDEFLGPFLTECEKMLEELNRLTPPPSKEESLKAFLKKLEEEE